jgi:uncharacterized hydrophobic protein (TIGR00271 family)
MVAASTAIASFGLIMDSTAVVIGAMLVAPLMTPILGLSLALVRGNAPLLGRAIQAVAVGTILSVALSAGFGFLMPALEATPEMLARTRPNLLDLLVAVFAGFAGAYALVDEKLSPALPGVAIATAIVPPLANSGLCLALGSFYGAAGSFLLFLTNFLSILLVAALLFIARGMVREPESMTKKTVVRRFGWATIGFLIIAAFLTKSLYNMVEIKRTRNVINKLLSEEFSYLPGTELRKVIHEKHEGKVYVVAKVYAVIDIRPSKVKIMEDKLTKELQEPVELFIRKRVVRDFSSSGSVAQGPKETLDGLIVTQEVDPRAKLLKLTRQIIYEYMETGLGYLVQKINLITLSGKSHIFATIFGLRDISPEEIQNLEAQIRQRTGDDTVDITFRQINGNLFNRLGQIYYEWFDFQALTPEREAMFNKLQDFLKLEFDSNEYFLNNIDLSIRGGIYHVLVELNGPKLYSQAEWEELSKKLVKITRNQVRLYVRSRPEVVLSESGHTSFNEMQDNFMKQAKTLYEKEMEEIVQEGF